MEDSRSSRAIVRFGAFELDPDAEELRRDGARIRLQEQPLQILQILLEQPGKIIPREELQRRLWPSDTFVDFARDGVGHFSLQGQHIAQIAFVTFRP